MRHRILLFLIVILLFVDVASAQWGRRVIRRPPPQEQGPGLPFGPREPLVQGDGRLLQRVFNVVNLFTEGGTELKPVAVFSLASFDEFKRTTLIVAEKIRLNKGSTEDPVFLKTVLSVYEQIVARGFDTQQPLGCILQTDGIIFYPLFFTPLNLESQPGQSILNRIAQPTPDGRYVVRQDVFRWPFGNLYIRQFNGWAFIASEQQLNALPEDPTTLLQGLDKECLIAARFDLFNMPRLATGAALSLGEMNGVAQAQTELEKAQIRLGIGYLRSLSEQADFLEYSLSYDEPNNDFIVEQREIVRPNTERQRLLQQRRDAVSPFHGFYHPDHAILASHVAMPLTRSQQENLEIILNETLGKTLLTEEERQELQQVLQPPPKQQRRPKPVAQQPAQQQAIQQPQRKEEAPTAKTANPDASARLAELLAMVPPEELANQEPPQNLEPLPTLADDDLPSGDLTDSQKLETIVRRIAVCYYLALLGSVRNGYLDGATTFSVEDGFMGAYNIVEGKAFRKAFDDLMTTLAEKYPKVYTEKVRKDYAESGGFSLTDISLRLDDLFSDAWWLPFVPEGARQRETRIVLGVRDDAVCFAVGKENLPEQRLRAAIAGTVESRPIDDMFFVFSAYELGQAISISGNPDHLPRFKSMFANGNPAARAYAVSTFTDTTKVLTLRISGLMTPSLWRMRENFRAATWR